MKLRRWRPIIWGEDLGHIDHPWGRRWVLDLGFMAFRLHKWFDLDVPPYMHDHAWAFVTFVLRGGYTDVSEVLDDDGKFSTCFTDHLQAPTVKYRPARFRHYVQTDKGGALTLVISFYPIREVKTWGLRC